jgi:hypothetical protein
MLYTQECNGNVKILNYNLGKCQKERTLQCIPLTITWLSQGKKKEAVKKISSHCF